MGNTPARLCPEIESGDVAFRSARTAGTDLELLARLLEPALGAEAALEHGRASLASAGSLYALVDQAVHGSGNEQPLCSLLLRAAYQLVGRYLYEPLNRGAPLTSPAETIAYLKHSLGCRRREVFLCLFLDTRHRVIHDETLFEGSIDGACVYPRVVAERALRHNAAAIIVAHNHPSGVSEPSLADQAITRRLKDALALFEIRLLDHFVIGDGEPVSMAARGMI